MSIRIARAAARPIQDQPTKPPVAGGPPNMPPPPAPGQPAGAAPELSLSFGAGKTPATAAPAPPRGVSAPTSPAKSRESLLQRVQSLTGAARDQGASILGMLWHWQAPTLRKIWQSISHITCRDGIIKSWYI